MAVTDQQIQQLFNSLNELTRAIKSGKNSFGGEDTSSGGGTRMGRGGQANGRSTRDTDRTVQALADNLKELHQSMKSGGTSIADHFKNLVKNMDPLANAFEKMEDVVRSAASTQTKAYNAAAKRTMEFVKEVSGNVDRLKDLNSEFADLVSAVNDVVDNQEKYADNQTLFNQKLQKIHDARAKLEAKDGFTKGKKILNGTLDLFLKNLQNNPNAKLSHNAQYGVNQLNDQYKAVSGLTKQFFQDITDSVKKASDEFQKTVESTLKTLGSAVAKDASKIPNYISSRLKFGFESNEFIDAFRMGLSPEELNQMRGANRDVLNGLSDFGKGLKKDSTESLRVWSDNAKQVGLIGKDASQFTSEWMRNAYQTGRRYDAELNQQLTTQAQVIQQVFGGSIQESAKLIQDYNTQIYNLTKFNAANEIKDENARKAQLEAAQNETKMRLLHAKYMGFEVEFMKQQQQARYNAAFSDIGDRIRSAILGQVAINTVKTQAGLSDEEARVYSLGAGNTGYQLNEQEQRTYDAALVKMSNYETKRMAEVTQATRTGSIAGLASSGLQDVVYQRLGNQAGFDRRGNTEAGQRAVAQQNARGNISFEDYIKFAEENQKKQAASVSEFDLAVQEFSESLSGFSGLPGAAIAGALGGAATQLAGAFIKKRLAQGALQTVAGRGGAGLLGRLGLGAVGGTGAAGAGTTAAGGITAGGVLAGTAGVAAAGAAGYGVGTLLSKWGSDAYNSNNALYKGASQVLNPLGYGGAAISNFFADRNQDNAMATLDRVQATGVVTPQDIDSLVKLRQVGQWFTSDEEDAKDRTEVTAQLQQLAAAGNRMRANAAARERPMSNALSVGIDSTNGVTRDANGNPIASSAADPIQQLVEIQKESLDVQKDTKKDANERAERDVIVQDQRTKAQRQQDFLASSYQGMF